MKFSYCMLPDYPLSDSIEMIKTADELGYHACYSVDETWHKDLWVLFAAAADKTSNIRFGPNVTHVFLREPTLICQQLATLDELTGGRMEAVVSTGNFGLMQQYHIDWEHRKPLSRLKEALHVMRTFLDEGKIDFQGDFFQYTGLFTAARPVQERHPAAHGRDEGAALVHRRRRDRRRPAPRALLLARGVRLRGRERPQGRVQRRARPQRVRRRRLGGHRRGRGLAAAKKAARIIVAFYISSMPPEQLERHGITTEEVAPVVEALGTGDVAKAIELFRPELSEKLSIAGTPEECVEKIKADIEPAGVNHMILCLTDAHLVEFFSGQAVEGVPDIQSQLKLVADRVMPAFG